MKICIEKCKGENVIFIKFFILFCILITCSYIGILKSKKYENRVLELNKFENALVMFKSKIEFTYEPIKEIFLDISKIIYNNENNFFKSTIEEKSDIYEAWCKSIDMNKNNLSLEDIEVIKMFGKQLGKTDLKGQVYEIELEQSLIKRQFEEAEVEKNKNVKLFKSIGVILGIGICIILI